MYLLAKESTIVFFGEIFKTKLACEVYIILPPMRLTNLAVVGQTSTPWGTSIIQENSSNQAISRNPPEGTQERLFE